MDSSGRRGMGRGWRRGDFRESWSRNEGGFMPRGRRAAEKPERQLPFNSFWDA